MAAQILSIDNSSESSDPTDLDVGTMVCLKATDNTVPDGVVYIYVTGDDSELTKIARLSREHPYWVIPATATYVFERLVGGEVGVFST